MNLTGVTNYSLTLSILQYGLFKIVFPGLKHKAEIENPSYANASVRITFAGPSSDLDKIEEYNTKLIKGIRLIEKKEISVINDLEKQAKTFQ